MAKYAIDDEVEVKQMQRGPDLVPMETWRHGIVVKEDHGRLTVECDNGDLFAVAGPDSDRIRKVTKAKIVKAEEPEVKPAAKTTTAKK